MFRVGQKVVCIAPVVGGYGDESNPVIGSVYTIRDIECPRPGGIHHTGLRFDEILNEPRAYRGYDELSEVSFSALKFRPIVERKADISVFTKMLADKRENIDA
jgi:hypothetical protein